MTDRVAVFLDGEFVKKTLSARLGQFPAHVDVMAQVQRILPHPDLTALSLYRVFYYTAEPLGGTAKDPLSGNSIDFAASQVFSRNRRLIDKIENESDVAVRRGTLVHQGWEIGRAALAGLMSGGKTSIEAGDLVPKILQKGVDMRIGLDIASLALKRLVFTIVLVSADSDLVPAMKLARREGLRVLLDTLGATYVRPELKIHADRVLSL